MAAADLGAAEWERSKITNQDLNLMKKLGITKKPKAVCFPSEESYPTPPMGYRDHPNLVSLPPLPEGGDVEERAVISDDNPDAPSFANEPAESRRSAGSDEKEDVSEATASAQSLPPAVSPRNKRKRDDVEDSGTSKVDEAVPSHQKAGYDPYLESIIKKLIEANERADTLALKLEQCEEARKKAESDAVEARQETDKAKADAAGVEDLRKRLHDAETSLSDHITAQSAREAAITKRIKTQSRRFVDRTSQEFELEDPDNDALLDAVSFLEFHGSEAREGMDEARAGLSKLFPYFFPKKEEPATFLGLAKCFNPPEDLGLKLRHENMKIAVESTVALVADSQQTIDWAKVGDTEQIEQAKWRSLIKAAKLNTKKILAYLGIKPSSTPSSSRPEV
ncbi:hypothetical protein QYE76_002154 [Lolium multiflorum]|uniref:FRIGIDA-like protein n=1 Tax=Lolium multiflorum TaxID=4521 RepID=A0AAD8VJ77_LOLMU|nr:hypothetical protein QYE76_032257 [Lolium multiflorum]KAK1627839.1 hypothetical protein QYE76_002154 [Lolium multiflorum]